jgi:calcineurin-like phosphoesterase family protein
MLKITKDTWIISDTHFGHNNMVKLCNRPYNFNDKIADGWGKVVRVDEDVLHLGDLTTFYGNVLILEAWVEVASRLPGNKYLIRGNHDKLDKYPGFTEVPEQLIEIGQTNILFSHFPKEKEDWWDLNIHGHLHGNTFHDYPFPLDWHMDIGVDVIGWKPVRLGEILNNQS